MLGHTGSIRGYESIVLYVPSIDVGLAVLVNQGPSEPVTIAARLVSILTQETSVNEQDEHSSMTIAPNPVSDICTVEGLRGGDNIIIMDVTGAVCMNLTSTGSHLQVDLRELSRGVYRLVAVNAASRRSHQIVVQR
ncbi:MAG: T9SS type A sorting domain-containing protein [Candidatus Kapaibacterium sp.]